MRVLFVDDEPQILNGIRRITSELEGDWEWLFAEGGRAALETLETFPADVLVSDLRMPGIGGAELLERVQKRWPGVVRIVLSGQSDQATILKTVSSAHQFLSKPCGADDLIYTLRRAETMHRLLKQPELRSIVSRLQNLPSAPDSYDTLVAKLSNVETPLRFICETISADVAMTAKLLQLVNSAFFGLSREIAEVTQAAVILGTDVLRALVLNLKAFTKFPNLENPDFSATESQRHSLTVCKIANAIGLHERLSQPEMATLTTAAMLHDIGKLALADSDPKLWQRIVKQAPNRSITYDAELKLMGTSHAEIGAYLLALWGLPEPLVRSVADHHRPNWSEGALCSPANVIAFADAVAHGNTDPSEIAAWLGLDEPLPIFTPWLTATQGTLDEAA